MRPTKICYKEDGEWGFSPSSPNLFKSHRQPASEIFSKISEKEPTFRGERARESPKFSRKFFRHLHAAKFVASFSMLWRRKLRRASVQVLESQAQSQYSEALTESRRNQGRISEILGKNLEAGMLRAWRARVQAFKSQGWRAKQRMSFWWKKVRVLTKTVSSLTKKV